MSECRYPKIPPPTRQVYFFRTYESPPYFISYVTSITVSGVFVKFLHRGRSRDLRIIDDVNRQIALGQCSRHTQCVDQLTQESFLLLSRIVVHLFGQLLHAPHIDSKDVGLAARGFAQHFLINGAAFDHVEYDADFHMLTLKFL